MGAESPGVTMMCGAISRRSAGPLATAWFADLPEEHRTLPCAEGEGMAIPTYAVPSTSRPNSSASSEVRRIDLVTRLGCLGGFGLLRMSL
jgi:hypothetical protein